MCHPEHRERRTAAAGRKAAEKLHAVCEGRASAGEAGCKVFPRLWSAKDSEEQRSVLETSIQR